MADIEEENEGGMIDLSSVEEDSGYEVLPRGTYDFIVSDAVYKLSQSSGNPMISLTLEVEGGEYAGRKLFTHVVFSPKALGMAKRTMARLGLEDLLQGPFNPEDHADDFIGKTGKARVAIGMYEGNQNNQVKEILPPSSGGMDDFMNS